MKLAYVALVAVTMMLVAVAPADARSHSASHVDWPHHDGYRHLARHHHTDVIIGGAFLFGPPLVYYPPSYAYVPSPFVVEPLPVYLQPTLQPYWYYCPTLGAYYPAVSSCPESWLPVPSIP